MTFQSKCKYCGSSSVYKSQYRSYSEMALRRLVFRTAYRCVHCNKRYFDWYFGPTPKDKNYSRAAVMEFWIRKTVRLVLMAALLVILAMLARMYLSGM